MRPQRSYLDYLRDILQATDEILHFVEGMDFPAFLADRRTNLAVVRALEIIGEAARSKSRGAGLVAGAGNALDRRNGIAR